MTLSKRKLEVFKHAANGLCDKEIADKMNVSYATIKSHVFQSLEITGCKSRTQLVYKLSKAGIL